MALNFQPIYVLASGGERALEKLDVATNNLANVNTPGFKKLLLREMSQYIPIKTDAPFDLAIFGEGFFGVQTPNGIKYTRNGHFLRNNEGFLVDSNGNYLLDDQGKRIQITDIRSKITFLEDGSIYAGDQPLGKLMIRNFSKFFSCKT